MAKRFEKISLQRFKMASMQMKLLSIISHEGKANQKTTFLPTKMLKIKETITRQGCGKTGTVDTKIKFASKSPQS